MGTITFEARAHEVQTTVRIYINDSLFETWEGPMNYLRAKAERACENFACTTGIPTAYIMEVN